MDIQGTILAHVSEAMGIEPETQEPEQEAPEQSVEPETPEPGTGEENEKESSEEQEGQEQAPPVEKVVIDGQELTLDEIKRNMLFQADYTRKTQEVAEKMKNVEVFMPFAEKMRTDPNFLQHVLSGYSGQAPAQAQAKVEQPPADPIEAIVWEAERNARAKIMAELSPQLDAVRRQVQLSAISQEYQKDPLFAEVQQGIIAYANRLPGELRLQTLQRLDVDPVAYGEMYNNVRGEIAAMKGKQPPASPGTAAAGRELSRVERAPVLESAGKTSPSGPAKSQRDQERAAAYRKIRSGEGGTEALTQFILNSPDFMSAMKIKE